MSAVSFGSQQIAPATHVIQQNERGLFIERKAGTLSSCVTNNTFYPIRAHFPHESVDTEPMSTSKLNNANSGNIQSLGLLYKTRIVRLPVSSQLKMKIDFSRYSSLILRKEDLGGFQLEMVTPRENASRLLFKTEDFYGLRSIRVTCVDGQEGEISTQAIAILPENIREISVTFENGQTKTLVLVNTPKE